MDEKDTERDVLRVYLPAYQKEQWREHADELGMNGSEFVKSMVQAGRRGFDSDERGSEDATPGVDGLEDRVVDALGDDCRSWDELVTSLTDDMEDRLETTLDRLQHENRVRYSGRRGGYTVRSDEGE